LFEKLAVLGGEAIVEAVKVLKSGKYELIPQDHSKATFAPMLTKEGANIDFGRTSGEIIDFVRGYNPAATEVFGERVKVFKAEKYEGDVTTKKYIVRKTADGYVRLSLIQYPNKRKMNDNEFLIGFKPSRN
jgi:methionyl-tRNA formyltransferase